MSVERFWCCVHGTLWVVPLQRRRKPQAGGLCSLSPGCVDVFDHQSLLIGRVHLLQLYQERAALLAEWGMAAAGRVAQISAGGVIAVFIRKGAFQHQDLFAPAMAVALMLWR